MALTRKIAGGWQGIVTGKVYYPPRECQESAEAQEQQARRNMPRLDRAAQYEKDSPEYVRAIIEEEALTNVQRADLDEMTSRFLEFKSLHPEYLDSDFNLNMMTEYWTLKGIPAVVWDGKLMPLVTRYEDWEEAYNWKLAHGQLQINPSVMGAKESLEASQRAAQEVITRREGDDEAASYAMPLNELAARARGWK